MTASMSIFLTITTIIGNALVILAVFLDPNKDLKCPFNYFVANHFRKAFKQLICCSPLRRRQEPEQLRRRTDP